MHPVRNAPTSSGSLDGQRVPRGSEIRRGIRGAAVAPQLGPIRRSPKRNSSVLHNIRGLSVPLPSSISHTILSKEDDESSDTGVTTVIPFRSEARRSPLRRSSSFSQLIRGPTEGQQILDSLSLLTQDGDSNLNPRGSIATLPGSNPRSLTRNRSYVLHKNQGTTNKSVIPETCKTRPRRNTLMPKFRELSIVVPESSDIPEEYRDDGRTSEFDQKLGNVNGDSPPPRKREAFVVLMPRPTERQPSHLVAAITFFGYSFAPFYDLWERLQISHCGQYSVERMLALDEYCQRVSLTRVVAVCLLFPLTPLLVVILLELMPLQSPEKGSLENYVFWIRNAAAIVIMIIVAMKQVKTWIPEMGLQLRRVLMITTITVVVASAFSLLIGDIWVFPIPFLVVISGPVLLVTWVLVTRAILGAHALDRVQDGAFRGRRSVYLILVHASLVFIYQGYQAGFLAVNGMSQLGIIALMPVINLALKNLQMALGTHLEDNLPEVIIFSVDAFSAIYSVLCMHSANSIKMVIVTLVINTLVMALSLHGMNRRSRTAQASRSYQQMQRQQQKLFRTQSVLESVVTGGGRPGLLNTLVVTTLKLLQTPGQLDISELRTIRLLSGLQQQLSETNTALLNSLAARCVYNSSRRSSEATSVSQIKSRYASVVTEGRLLSSIHFPIPSSAPSKLVQRLRAAILTLPVTTKRMSMRMGVHFTKDLSVPEYSRRDSSENTDSTGSDKDNFQSLPTIAPTETPIVPIAPQEPVPRISQLIAKSSLSTSEQNALQSTVPSLWQDTSVKLIPLIRTSNPVISDVLQESRKQNTRAVKQTLQLLFNNEYLGLIAYTQFIIPIMYLLYMPILQAVPNRAYYPTHFRYFGNTAEFDERMMVIGILAVLQLAVLLVLQVFVIKRFAVSTIYQVAFVLEKHFTLLQGRLLVWLIFAVQTTLVHYGADFSFQFDWMERKH